MAMHTTAFPHPLRPDVFTPASSRRGTPVQWWKNRSTWGGCLVASLVVAAVALEVHASAAVAEASSEQRTAFVRPAASVVLPAKIVANFFVVESTDANGVARRFVIDTGSTVTLVTAEFATTFSGDKPGDRRAEVFAPTGEMTTKDRVTLSRLSLGRARYSDVPAVIADLNELSRHLGLKVDGIIGFPVFRHQLLTLDYARGEMTIAAPTTTVHASSHGMVFAMEAGQRVPFVKVQIGDQTSQVLVDTGSDGGLHLNPENLALRLTGPARVGALVSSVAGDRRQYLGQLTEEVRFGGASMTRPVVDFTRGTSSVGGEVLKHFAVTFDQRRGEVTFRKTTSHPIKLEARRTVGLSFARDEGAWLVAGIIPETPGAQVSLQAGDRCVRINGELVDQWPAERYAALLSSAEKVTFTFARGDRSTDVQLPVVKLL